MAAVFYISGHGFGHAVRTLAIIDALATLRPDLPLFVRSSVPEWLVARNAPRHVCYEPATVDTGAVQRSSLEVDVAATIGEAARFMATLDARASEEARWLGAIGARVVVGDIPPLAFVAASLAGLPSFGISNFTWDWIYADYEAALALMPRLSEALGGCYARATEGWRLPMCGGFETFPRCRDLPLVARRARRSREEIRARFGLPPDQPLVLVSLGGFGAAGIDVGAAARSLRGVAGVVTTSYDAFAGIPGLYSIDEGCFGSTGPRYEDLVGAVDIVASKPGYGIISDCAANGTALLYTSRGRFREYDVLVREMPGYIRARFIDLESMIAGRWRDPVEHLLAAPGVSPPPTDGAPLAASWLASHLGTVPERA